MCKVVNSTRPKLVHFSVTAVLNRSKTDVNVLVNATLSKEVDWIVKNNLLSIDYSRFELRLPIR